MKGYRIRVGAILVGVCTEPDAEGKISRIMLHVPALREAYPGEDLHSPAKLLNLAHHLRGFDILEGENQAVLRRDCTIEKASTASLGDQSRVIVVEGCVLLS